LYLLDFYKKANPTEADRYAKEVEKISNSDSLKNDASSFFVSLGNYYLEKNDYEKAESFYLKAYNLQKNDSTEPTNSLGYLIDLYKRMGKWEKAFEYQKIYDELGKYVNYNIDELSFTINFSLVSGIWSDENILQIVNYYPVQDAINHAYDIVLFSKGIELLTIRNTHNSIHQSNNQNLKNSYKQLYLVYDKMNTIKSEKNLTMLEKSASLIELGNARDSLKKIVESSLANEFIQNNTITWENIQSNLFDKAAAIEFVNFSHIDYQKQDTLTTYAALLLRKDFKSPIYIPLFEKSQLDSLLLKDNAKDNIRIKNLYTGSGQKLYQLVWQPLEKYLQGIETVYYSPSGMLNKIAFSAIPVDSVLLMDKYNLQLLSSTREIVREKNEKQVFLPLHSAVEYGGIIYDADDKKLLNAAAHVQPTQTNLFAPDTIIRSNMEYLERSADEVNEVEVLLNQAKIPNIKFMGLQATEESFKQLSGNSPELLHIATHGFFLEDEKQIGKNGFMKTMNSQNQAYINPLLRSGLLFAGANRAWINDDVLADIEDGILTAEEISHLDLSKTKLVVLSACETGLGEVNNSEGVFGLQRAFKLAGVQTIVMSLWKVPDEATSKLMIDFYQNLLSGKSKQESFKKAQQNVRDEYKNPYYWAGFVMMN